MLLLWDQYNFSCLLCCILKAYAETPFPPRIWNIRSWFELHYLKRGNVAHNIIFITYSLSHLTHINITIELPSVIKFLFLIKGGSRKYVIDTVGCVLLWAILGKGGRLETNGFQFFFPILKVNIFFWQLYLSMSSSNLDFEGSQWKGKPMSSERLIARTFTLHWVWLAMLKWDLRISPRPVVFATTRNVPLNLVG